MGKYFQPLNGNSSSAVINGNASAPGASPVTKAGCGCGGHSAPAPSDVQLMQHMYCRRREIVQHVQLVMYLIISFYFFILLIRALRGSAA